MKTLLTVALGLLALAGPSQAQSAHAPSVLAAVASGDAEWSPRVSPQLVSALGSPSASERTRALHAVGTLAYAAPDGVDLRPAIPALLHVFRTDPDWRLRVQALRSLETSDDDGVMTALRAELERQMEPPVQRVLLAVLVDHYGMEAARRDSGMMAVAQSLIERDRRRVRGAAPRAPLAAAG